MVQMLTWVARDLSHLSFPPNHICDSSMYWRLSRLWISSPTSLPKTIHEQSASVRHPANNVHATVTPSSYLLTFLLSSAFPSLVFSCHCIFFCFEHKLANLLSSDCWVLRLFARISRTSVVSARCSQKEKSVFLPLSCNAFNPSVRLRSPKQTYRLQPSHQHSSWSSCEPELFLL